MKKSAILTAVAALVLQSCQFSQNYDISGFGVSYTDGDQTLAANLMFQRTGKRTVPTMPVMPVPASIRERALAVSTTPAK